MKKRKKNVCQPRYQPVCNRANSLEVGQFLPGDMNVENIVGQPPQSARRQQSQLIWKGPTHLERPTQLERANSSGRASSSGKHKQKD